MGTATTATAGREGEAGAYPLAARPFASGGAGAAAAAAAAPAAAFVYAGLAEDTELFHPDDWEQGEGCRVRERRPCRLYGWDEGACPPLPRPVRPGPGTGRRLPGGKAG